MKLMEIHPKTAYINKVQRAASRKSRQDAMTWLAKTFPKAFDTKTKVQPLKISIIDDIFAYMDQTNETRFSKSKIREALVIFTRRIDYLACLKTMNQRVDLEGISVAEVTPEEAENAALKIKKSIEKNMQQRRRPEPQRSAYASGNKAPAMIRLKKRPQKEYDPNAIARFKQRLGVRKEGKEEIEYNSN